MSSSAMVVQYLDTVAGTSIRALVLSDGTAYTKAAVPRPRWHRMAHRLEIGTVQTMLKVPEERLEAGPAFMVLTDDEHQALSQRPGAVPRSANDRFERVRAQLERTGTRGQLDQEVMLRWQIMPDGAPIHPSGELRPDPAPASPEPAPGAPAPAPDGEAPLMSLDYPPVSGGSVEVEGGRYITRKIGRRSDVAILREYRERGRSVITFGPAGTGKTELFRAAFGGLLRTIVCSEDLVAPDLVGDYVRSYDEREWVYQDGPLIECMEAGLPLLVDEINRARQKQLAPLFSALDRRRQVFVTAGRPRVVTAAPGFTVVASANLSTATGELDEALSSRFALKLEVQTDFAMLREQLGVDPAICVAAENLNVRRLNREIGWSPQTRDLLHMQENIELIGMPAALGSLVNSAPVRDREVVADVLSKALGRKITNLVLA